MGESSDGKNKIESKPKGWGISLSIDNTSGQSSDGTSLQLNKYKTDPYFLQIFQSNTSLCLIISVFCKSLLRTHL